MGFRQDINGLRAIAVLMVLFYHFGVPGFGAGFVGVDVFFVISGFLMTSIIVSGLEKRTFSIPGFYRSRLFRLYPALLSLVVATLLFGLVFVEPVALERIARDGLQRCCSFPISYSGALPAILALLPTRCGCCTHGRSRSNGSFI